jgi:hypothetical protein
VLHLVAAPYQVALDDVGHDITHGVADVQTLGRRVRELDEVVGGNRRVGLGAVYLVTARRGPARER